MTLTIDFNDHLLFNLRQDSETVFFFISLIKTILEPDLFVHYGVVPYPTVAFTDYDVFFHTIALIMVIGPSRVQFGL